MENTKRSFLSTQFVLGLLIIAVGVLFMLDNLGLFYAGDLLRYWPALLVVWGLTKVTQAPGTPGQVFGWILIAVGSLMVLDRMNVIDFRVWDWWPVILIIIGLNFLRSSVNRTRRVEARIETGAGAGEETDAYFRNVALLSGVKRSITSREFRGGELTAVMGGCEIDLREAEIAGDEAVLDVFVLWGGIEVRVPMGWTVTVKALPIMGGVDEKVYPPKEGPAKRLVLTGNIVMGGVEIKN
ncbi:MAG: cell wall-active antibiotics response protein [Bacteroidetes bacterium]|nr:MAG: cell wall-active antibiotics response protein [Bacteroidota bacterium]